MDINIFLTQKAAQGTGKSPASPQALMNGNGIFSGIPGANFMDLIFARLAAEAASETPAEASPAKADALSPQESIFFTKPATPALAPETSGTAPTISLAAGPALATGETSPDAEILQIEPLLSEAPATPGEPALENGPASSAFQTADFEGALDIPVISVPEQPGLLPSAPQTIHGNKKLAALFESLLQGTPQNGEPVMIPLAPGKIKNLIAQATGEKDLPASALIATGLSPEQLTEILKDIADGNEQGEVFVVGLVKILPEESRKEAVFLPRGIVIVPKQPSTGESTPAQTESGAGGTDAPLAAKLNALTVGGEEAPVEESDFEDILRVFEQAQESASKTGQQNNSPNALEAALRQAKPQAGAGVPGNAAGPVASTLPGAPPAPDELFTNFSASAVYPEGWDFATGSAHSLNVTGPAQLTSMISHIQQAGMPHPATQLVASVIAKNAAGGESRNITIQLDPPDLGKVSVRLEFQKDGNAMKALLIAEKPETYLMLQRDAHTLERALQDAGINADGGLSFQLSQDGGAFGHDQHSTGGNSGGGSGNQEDSSGQDLEITQTRMDWYVDPQTGQTRYDAFV